MAFWDNQAGFEALWLRLERWAHNPLKFNVDIAKVLDYLVRCMPG